MTDLTTAEEKSAGNTRADEDLTLPRFEPPVPTERAREMVELDPELKKCVELQVESFVQGLLTADVHGGDFRKRIDQLFKLGRKEIADATRLNSSFLRKGYVGIEKEPAFRAMTELRTVMEGLNPSRHGDLLKPARVFGLFPGGTRLKAYLRKFESAGAQIDKLSHQLSVAQDDLERDAISIEDAKTQLWAAMQNLKAAAHFSEILQNRLREQVDACKTSDPLRARALEQEALFYAVQNLEGILTQQAVTVNGYLALEPLQKTARELSNGIDRLKTTGMAALSVAQILAIATGNQIRVAEAMGKTKEVIGNLVVQTSVQLGQHVNTTAKFATDPIIEINKLQTAFDNTFKAIDDMENFRSAAIGNMQKNNQALQQLIEQAKPCLERAAGSEKVDAATAGPVHLGTP